MRREKSNYMIQSVAHAIDVLEQFGGEFDELGVTELSKRLKLHKNNVFRLLATLESRGYIEQNRGTGNYHLGIRCLQIGQRFIAHMGLLKQAQPILADLARTSGETAFVTVHRRGAMVPVAAAESTRSVRIAGNVGELLPLHSSAAGKAYLAFAPTEEAQESLPNPLPRFTPNTLTDRQALATQLSEVTQRGFAVDCAEYLEEVHSVAVPIRDYTRAVVACLAVSGPAYRMTKAEIDTRIVPKVTAAATDLSSRLGFNA